MINIQEKMREVKKLKKELNEQFTKELLKECNLKKLPSYPLHLGKDVKVDLVIFYKGFFFIYDNKKEIKL